MLLLLPLPLLLLPLLLLSQLLLLLPLLLLLLLLLLLRVVVMLLRVLLLLMLRRRLLLLRLAAWHCGHVWTGPVLEKRVARHPWRLLLLLLHRRCIESAEGSVAEAACAGGGRVDRPVRVELC